MRTLTIAVAIFCLTAMANAEPLFEETDVFVHGEHGVAEYRILALVTTNEGTLLAVCDARVDRPGDAPNNIDLALKRSEDMGRTWTDHQVVVDLPGQMAAGDPCMLVDRQTGSIWIFYDHVYPSMEVLQEKAPELTEGAHAGYKGRVLFLHAIHSDDDGRTWSEAMDLTPAVKQPDWIGAMSGPGMGIQTRDGRLIAPGYRRRAGDFAQDASHFYYSDDHGETWHVSATPGPRTNESQVVELVDGSLMMNMRSMRGHHCRAVATTTDGGQTWSEIRDDTTLIEPRCQASFVRWTDERNGYAHNRLLFANPASADSRTNMTARLSYDEGQTWPVSKVVNPGPAAYSCLTILPDGTAGLLYENVGQSDAAPGYEKITFARFNIEWLTDGEDSLQAR
ncbi:MAG: sialidase family protein [Armatimonadota bacterium]|nr:sialidase family protein [Armatimonadota bacterium]